MEEVPWRGGDAPLILGNIPFILACEESLHACLLGSEERLHAHDKWGQAARMWARVACMWGMPAMALLSTFPFAPYDVYI